MEIPYQVLANGSKLPSIGLGTWHLRGEEAVKAVQTGLELGYRHLDTARMYGNEAEVAAGIAASGVPRQDVFITTKLMPLEPREVEAAINERLQLLKTDYLDLLLIHWPPAHGAAAEMWQLMAAEQRAGVLRNIGVSNYSTEQIMQLIKQTKVKPTVNQIEISPFNSQTELRTFCEQQEILVEAYSPLTQQQRLDHPVIVDVAEKYERSPAQIMLRWCLQRNTVPLPKATSREHLAENLHIFDFELSDIDLAQLDLLDEGLTVIHRRRIKAYLQAHALLKRS